MNALFVKTTLDYINWLKHSELELVTMEIVRYYCLICLLFYSSLLLTHTSSSSVIQINKNSTNTLQDYLCGSSERTLESGTVLSLSSDYLHNMTPGPFCLLESLFNVTIQSESSSIKATILCSTNTSTVQPTFGFGFYNFTSLSLINIHIINCGGYLGHDVRQYLNHIFSYSAQIFVPETQTSVLIIIESTAVALQHVRIDGSYYGYAIMAVNLIGEALLQDISIQRDSESCTYNYCQGSGLLLFASTPQHYTDTQHTVITLSQSNIKHNTNHHFAGTTNPVDDLYYSYRPVPIFGAGGLTVIIGQHPSIVINMYKVMILKNKGNVVGGALFFIIACKTDVTFNVTSSVFMGNTLTSLRRGAGIGIFVKMCEENLSIVNKLPRLLMTFNKCYISENSGASHGSGFFIQLPNTPLITGTVHFKNCLICINTAAMDGHAIYITSNTIAVAENIESLISVVIENSVIGRNGLGSFPFSIDSRHSQWKEYWDLLSGSTVKFVRISNVTIIGGPMMLFGENSGHAIAAVQTNIVLTKTVNFRYNYIDV